MNDFTKEELEFIHDKLSWICEDYSEPDSTYELRDKVQSMIDNYCEHNNLRQKRNDEYVAMCRDCGSVFV